jgi:hypothetical protein
MLDLNVTFDKLYNWCKCGQAVKVGRPFSNYQFTCKCGRVYKQVGYIGYINEKEETLSDVNIA